MKLFYIRYKTLYKVVLALVILMVILVFSIIGIKSRSSKETFYNDDVIYKGTKDTKTIAFACNIDWGEEHIPKMLDIFKENKINITFFPTGRWAEKNPDLLKDIHKSGNEIGNHGFTHRDYDKLDYQQNKEEISKSHDTIKGIIKVEPKHFAPPSGAFNDSTVKAAKELNYNVIMWSVDTIDWRKDSTRDIIVDRVVSKAHNSAIVLMHPTEETVKALPIMIQSLKEKGYKIGKISDIID
ncbi:peptidoglycan-N-acetylglucosamine deacetylase PgdA [Gottschalkia purinilytica]|uniref:Peptidoglycan-N-acetylglucosamine deacetylase PgdA n=1 Tax=Gottschalkia purinilytica TaxID=1503 RepID=A0A0L0WBH0_GOTPU|nr:polysaccharide deacetylase family protein [Gottschalkia purinilytica]KNF08869.1 peptidoglycan-N-acetylglucosamine deacetylase PgdA [Gottschalkia purinilytica]